MNKRILIPLLILFLMFSMVVSGAPTYVNIGPTTEFTGDIGIPLGFGYYIGDNKLEIDELVAGWTFTHMEDTLFFGAFSNIYYVKYGNLDAISAPTVNDDIDLDYMVGSRWIDVTADKEYICLDNTDGAAVWTETTGAASGYTNLTSFVDQTAWRVFYSNIDGDVIELALGTSGQYLKSTGATSAPIFDTPAGAGDMLKAIYDADEDDEIDVAGGGTEKDSWTQYAIPYLSNTTVFGEIPIGTAEYALTVAAGATGYDWTELAFLSDSGDTGTGIYDFGGATSFEIPNSATPSLTVAGQLAYDTTVTGLANGCLSYYGAEIRYVIDLDTLPSNDDYVIAYDADADKFYMKVDAGGTGATTFVGLTDTPANYTDAANKFIQVNVTPDALIFDTISSDDLSDVASIAMLDENEDITGAWTVSTGSIAGVDTTEFGYLDGVTSDIQTQFGLRYLKTEIDTQGEMETIWGDTLMNDLVDDLAPGLGGEMDSGAHTIGFTLQSTTGDGTTTIDWRLGNKFKFTFGAQSETFTFTAPTNPCTLMLTIIQDATGSRTITWPGTCKWPGGTEGTLTTTANARDKVALDWDGTQYDCQMANDFK